jgi:hypothetical protein
MFNKPSYLSKNLRHFKKKYRKILWNKYLTSGSITITFKKTKLNSYKISKKSLNFKSFEIFLNYGLIKLMSSDDGTS